MHCCEFTFSGSHSRFYVPLNPNVAAAESISGHRSRIFFPKIAAPNPARLRFCSIRADASFNNGIEVFDVNFYDLLGIPESGSLIEIKKAYKQLARKYHPDVSPPDKVEEYTKRFIRVQEAYETLSDPRRRAIYDRDTVRGLQFAFSARRRYNEDEGVYDRSEWQNRWQSQLSELKRRSMNEDASGNSSWGARMRRQMMEKV